MADLTKPTEDDIREDDHEYNPAVEPKSAKAWLNLLRESEDAFDDYNMHCDRIDKLFANLQRLANKARDKEFSMFWANMEVIKPAIYAKAPVPVVVPKFKDRRPVYQAASELMERCCIVAFDLTRINELMLLCRDDLAMISRGVAWCRYESSKSDNYYDSERVCIDFKNRRDFLHSVSRNWREVTWVAAASYLTRTEARKRFRKHSGDEYQEADYKVDRDTKEIGGADNRERAKFWEVWDKSTRRVVWVAEGCDKLLDDSEPHLDLLNYFPCPQPAYGTVQRGSLVPVPDVLQYKDQLEEMNLLTGRIHALSEALEAKGFYPAGGVELAEAVETAVKTQTSGRLLVPISNWAAFGGSKEVIIWLPIDMISATITALVTLRKQVIDDIYQIMGLSDIMRGDTEAQETLGAQQLKTQYGSARVKDKQGELARLARDLVEITSEIITEKFDPVTMIEMSQTELPTQQMQQQQIKQIQQQMQQQQQQAQQLMQNPQAKQMLQSNPQQGQQAMQMFQQLMQKGQESIQKISDQPSIDQVLKFLKNNRIKSFVLDIETDSTIMADEMGEKQRRTEFVGVLSQLLPQLGMMVAQQPNTAKFCGELLKFSIAPFRAGRSMDGAIDELVQQMEQMGQGQKPDDPITAKAKADKEVEQMKLTYAKEKDTADRELKKQEIQFKGQIELQKAKGDPQQMQQEAMHKQQEHQQKLQLGQQKMATDAQHHQGMLMQAAAKTQAEREKAGMQMQTEAAKLDAQSRMNEQKASQAAQMHQDKRVGMQQAAQIKQQQMLQPKPMPRGR